jgi:hypothetical protein
VALVAPRRGRLVSRLRLRSTAAWGARGLDGARSLEALVRAAQREVLRALREERSSGRENELFFGFGPRAAMDKATWNPWAGSENGERSGWSGGERGRALAA